MGTVLSDLTDEYSNPTPDLPYFFQLSVSAFELWLKGFSIAHLIRKLECQVVSLNDIGHGNVLQQGGYIPNVLRVGEWYGIMSGGPFCVVVD
jgi:hypothetical protein